RLRPHSLPWGVPASARPDARPGEPAAGWCAAQHDPHAARRGLSAPVVHRPRRDLRGDVAHRSAHLRSPDGARSVSWRAVVATVLLICGGAIELLAVLGLCAMRDVYDRLHYV